MWHGGRTSQEMTFCSFYYFWTVVITEMIVQLKLKKIVESKIYCFVIVDPLYNEKTWYSFKP